MNPGDLGRIVDCSKISMRVAADTVKKEVYLQFYLTDPAKEGESYSVKMSWEQFLAIVESHKDIQDQADMFEQLADEMNAPD